MQVRAVATFHSSADGGTRALSGSSDHSLRVWDLSEGLTLDVFEGHEAKVLSVATAKARRPPTPSTAPCSFHSPYSRWPRPRRGAPPLPQRPLL